MGTMFIAVLGIRMLTRLKISFVLLPVAIAILAGIYVYSLWAAERQRAADVPVESADAMMRDLLLFHKKRGGFPKDLKELEGVVWEKKESRSYSEDKRGLTHRNYYYLFTRINHHRFTLWAIPMGRQREDAPTWFLLVTPESHRRWKGSALNPEDVKGLSLDPSANQLSVLGLLEQTSTLRSKRLGIPTVEHACKNFLSAIYGSMLSTQ